MPRRSRSTDGLGGAGASKSPTQRERDCLALLVRGLTDHDIATHLRISEPTVRFHLNNVRRKLGAISRTHLAALAIWLGLARVPEKWKPVFRKGHATTEKSRATSRFNWIGMCSRSRSGRSDRYERGETIHFLTVARLQRCSCKTPPLSVPIVMPTRRFWPHGGDTNPAGRACRVPSCRAAAKRGWGCEENFCRDRGRLHHRLGHYAGACGRHGT
jgi:DNA-binding CsgD family transcriptional regulator